MTTLAPSNFYFAPDGERSRHMDQRAHELLADSLEHIQSRAGDIFSPATLAPLITRLRGGQRVGPACFGWYYELAIALMQNQPHTARALAERLEHMQPASQPISLVSIHSLEEAQAALYRRLMDTDPDTLFSLSAPSARQIATFQNRYQEAWALMQKHLPELASEFSGLVREIIMVTADSSSKYAFDGGSSYMLWGGLFLNIASHSSDIALVEVLAHESAHSLLFGFSQDEALVLNDTNDRFPSPLRDDPRPMDGIYHATYVSARMHRAMSQLLAQDGLSGEQRQHAQRAAKRDASSFFEGYEVIRQHGRLSATGKAVMAAALHYMQATS